MISDIHQCLITLKIIRKRAPMCQKDGDFFFLINARSNDNIKIMLKNNTSPERTFFGAPCIIYLGEIACSINPHNGNHFPNGNPKNSKASSIGVHQIQNILT